MQYLNLKKDPVLLLLLQNIIRTGKKIKSPDDSVVKVLNELENTFLKLEEVDYNHLHNLIVKFAEIVKSYGIKGSEDELVLKEMPEIIYNFMTGLDDLKNQAYLDNKYYSTAELEGMVNAFCKKVGL